MSIINSSLRVALLWNGTVFQEKTFSQMSEPVVTVGDDAKNMFIVPAEGLPASLGMFERTKDHDYTLRFTDKVEGQVTLGDEEYDLDELIAQGKANKAGSASLEKGSANLYEVTLRSGDWGTIQIGESTVFFQTMDKMPVAPPRGFFTGLELALAGFIFLSAICHITFLLVAYLAFDPPVSPELIQIDDRFVKLMVEDLKDPPEEEELEIPEEDTTGKKAGGEEGKFGAEDSDIPESKIPKVDGEMRDNIDVKNIGVNKALGSALLGAGPLKQVFGDATGLDATMNVAMSGEGGDLQIGRGAGGMGMRGTGDGGGGKDGFGRIGGLGRVDTGGGKGAGGKIGGKAKQKAPVKFRAETPKLGDFCDKADIRRVVNAKQAAIRYCFEKELQSNPSLGGKIIAQWNVMMDGSVKNGSISSSSMNNSSVEGCIVRVIERMRFATPNGGICVINYPFVFSGIE